MLFVVGLVDSLNAPGPRSVIENDLHHRADVLAEPFHFPVGLFVHRGQKLDAVGQGL